MKNLKAYIDLKLISVLSAVYLIINLVNFGKNIYFKWLGYAFRGQSYLTVLENMIFNWLAVTFFLIFLVILVKYLLVHNTPLIWSIIIHIFLSFFIGTFALWVDFTIRGIYNVLALENREAFINAVLRLVDLHFLIYLSFITIIYMYYYFKKTQENKLQAITLQEQLSKTHLKFLQSQIHPHFLFNTLNGIHSLIDIDTNKSKSMIVDLSDLLRNVLDKKDENLIELQEELDILKKYIHIKKTRFSDQLTFNLNIEDGLENVLVPNMILQPLIENSTKHGFSDEHKIIDISITIKKEGENIKIKVENTGRPIEKPSSTLLKKGTGLNNINERLISLFNTNYDLKIYNHSNKVITEIVFPIQFSISEITENQLQKRGQSNQTVLFKINYS